ncbi:MAG: long-chain fatty acid--CoA ligase [Phaeospirillum sp.]|nr:long-chain fatty acid--CoA ligase [Phaeospirillum sp.]
MKSAFETLWRDAGDCEFFVDGDISVTYADLAAAVDAAVLALRDFGVAPSVPVLIKGDFSSHSIAVLLALIANGNIVIPHTEASLDKLRPEVDLLCPAFLVDAGAAPFTIERLAAAGPSCLMGLLPKGVPGLVVFSSGTTGRPKAIVHNVDLLLEKFSARPSKRVRAIPFLLFDHMGGFNTMLSILCGRGCIVYSRDRGIDAICAAISRFKVDLLPTTPTFLTMLLVSGAWKVHDLSSLKVVTYGTEVMNEAVLARLVAVLPHVRFKQTYGLSEVGVLMTSSRGNDNTWVKLIGDGLETKVEDGILWIRVPSVMLGRVLFDGDSARFEPHGDAWFCTSDMVDVDGEYFRFKGRATDIISVSGLKVYPSEVENCLLECTDVANAVVFGKHNALVGQVVVAQIERSDPALPPAEARKRVLAHCRARLDRFKVPQEIQFIDHIGVSDRLKKKRTAEDA